MTRDLVDRLSPLGAQIGFAIGGFLAKIFPPRPLCALSERLADLSFYLFFQFRKRSVQNLSVAFGDELGREEVKDIARKSLRNFFRDFVEMCLALDAPAEEIREAIPMVGREHLEAALSRGQGVIVLSGHLGNFFLLGTRLRAEGYSTSVLVNPTRNGRLAAVMDRYRLKVGQKTIHARPRRKASHELSQALRRNELVVMIADEYRKKGVPVKFFGRWVLARRGPVTLALRTGAALLPSYLVRDQAGRLKLIIEPELRLSRSGRTAEDLIENMFRITGELERAVRSYPDQWNWMNIRWQEAPTGAAQRILAEARK